MSLTTNELLNAIMIYSLVEKLKRKHLLIIGKSESDRRKFISELITASNLVYCRFPSGMTTFDEYLDHIRSQKLYTPFYKAKTYNANQILDFHSDYVSENAPLLVFEEFQDMEERWKHEIFRQYLNENDGRKKGAQKMHLVVSMNTENGLIDELAELVNRQENEPRTPRQIVAQNLEIIDLGHSNENLI